MTIQVCVNRHCQIAKFVVFLALLLACSIASAAEPKRVLMIYSFGREFKPWSEYARRIRTELDRQSRWPLEIIEHSLVSARFREDDSEGPFIEYLRALFAKRPLDLIVSVGAPAADFVQRNRPQVFATTPMLLTTVEQRRVQNSKLTANDVVVAVSHDFPAIIANILRVLPDTKTIAVVNGNSSLERLWLDDMRQEFAPFADRLSFLWWDDQPFEEILKRAAALPPQSAIFWHLMNVDAAGIVHEGDNGLPRLYAVANAPIFSYADTFFGSEIVGGPMHSALEGSRKTAEVALRLLGGEKASEIKVPPSGFAAPRFDWRQMQRWGISESRLPPGSEILFRSATVWERYRVYIVAVIAAILVQSGLIFWLLYEHRWRHRAEIVARNSMSELTYMNRLATAGELSASIAHEVNQPLASIVVNAHAALRLLSGDAPNIEEARSGLDRIIGAALRAGDIIKNVRAMFRDERHERVQVHINELIRSVLTLCRIDLQKCEIEVETQLDEKIPHVIANRVQLQQVISNLIINSIEAMRSVRPRVLKVKSDQSSPEMVHVSIEDTGTGIDSSNLKKVFNPLFTTKERGMGMGLSICHSIIENHNGRIWVSPAINGGSIFQFELPVKGQRMIEKNNRGQPSIGVHQEIAHR
jgi:signal transduction histidine kinase